MKILVKFYFLINLTGCISAGAQNNFVIDSLQIVLKTAKEDTNKVKSLNALVRQFINISEYEVAMQYSKLALALAEKLNFEKEKTRAYYSMGVICLAQGNYDTALKYFLPALEILKGGNDVYNLIGAYNYIGRIYQKKGNNLLALNNYNEALRISTKLGDKDYMARTYTSIGVYYQILNNYPEALNNHYKALKIHEEMGNKRSMANCYSNIGWIYSRLKDSEGVIKCFEASSKINKEIGNKSGMAGDLVNIGLVYEEKGNFPEALKNYLASLRIYNEIGSKTDIAEVSIYVGWIYFARGDYEESLTYYYKALEISEESGDKSNMAYAYENIGVTLIGQAAHLNTTESKLKYDEASFCLKKSLEIAKDIGLIEEVKDSYYSLAVIDSALGNYSSALENYKLYTLHKDSILNEESSKQTSQLKIQYETEKKDKEIDMLNKENEIKNLQVRQQHSALLASKYESEKNQNQMLLLNTTNEVQQLMLVKTQKDLAHQQAEAKVKAAELELIHKDKLIKEQKLEKQTLQRNGIIIGAVLLMLLGVIIFRSIHLRRKLEKQEAITHERKRISADLHDDIGSGLSRISLLSEMVRKDAISPETKAEAKKIAETSLELSENISEIIWALNSNNDYLENLVAYIRRYAGEYFENSPVRLKITSPENIPHNPINGEHRRNLFYVVKEALHNIIKHSHATEAELKFAVSNNQLSVIIKDNGIGLPDSELNRFGNGMKNMLNRIKSINGKFSIENHQGTKITLSIPV